MYIIGILFLLSGDSLNSSLVAIVSVDPEVMKSWAASQGIKVSSVSFSCLLFST